MNTTEFNHYEIDAIDARYIKLIGFGRFNVDVDTRTSVWSAVREIEFYGSQIVSVSENEVSITPLLYPNPAKNMLQIKSTKPFESVSIYNVAGYKILEEKLSQPILEHTLDISSISNGAYFVSLQGDHNFQSKKFLIFDK